MRAVTALAVGTRLSGRPRPFLAVVGHNFAATKWTNQVQRTSGGHTDWGAGVVTPVGDENTLSVIIYVSTDHGAWKYALVGALMHSLIGMRVRLGDDAVVTPGDLRRR